MVSKVLVWGVVFYHDYKSGYVLYCLVVVTLPSVSGVKLTWIAITFRSMFRSHLCCTSKGK
nr:hypothetical protein Q903MT_gene2666 [Picea sitchensis]